MRYLTAVDELQQRIHGWIWRTFFVFLAVYAATTAITLATLPSAIDNFHAIPWAWAIVGLNALAIANIPRAIHLGKPFYSFISSCCTIAALTFLLWNYFRSWPGVW